jgi:muconate cycloisomerase
MKIVAIDFFAYEAPFLYGYHSAHLIRLRADSLIIALRCEDGVTGYGESVPRPYVTGESPASVRKLFETTFTDFLIGQEVDAITDVERLLENLKQVCRNQGITQFQSALGAVDIALLDALGKHHCVPVCRLLGPELRRKIPWSIVIPMFPEAIIRKFSEECVRRTFSSLKVLVGRDEVQNGKRMKLVRELFGDEIAIRIEVNGYWTRGEAQSNLKELMQFGITAVEQPVAKGDIDGLREIREKFGIPVIVDESMCGPEDAEELITQCACDILNIKISKVGGLLSARRIASQAASRGVTCLLGCHVGETNILTNAAFHFLVTTPNLLLVEGFSSFLFGKVSKIDDLDPENLIEDIFTTEGLGFNPADTILREPFSEGSAKSLAHGAVIA